MYKRKSAIIVISLILGYVGALAQESRREIRIDFRVGRSAIDTAFGDNAARLSEIAAALEEIGRDTLTDLAEVILGGSASPEGGFAVNRRLAAERLAALERYVRERLAIPDSLVLRGDGFVAWERLAGLVERSAMPHKEEALDVLRRVPEFTYDSDGRLADSRKRQLMRLQGGRTWHFMQERFFGQIRNADVVLVTVRRIQGLPAEEERRVDEDGLRAESDSLVAGSGVPDGGEDALQAAPAAKNRYWSLHTNALYDLLLVPNAGAEFYLGGGWSVAAEWMYGWWKGDRRRRYWRVYGGDIALRRWFGARAAEKPLTGHHLGVYAQALTYDFEFGGKGRMGGEPGGNIFDRASYAAGVEYGYALPVARRINIDFAIGVGYLGGTYYEYLPIDNHYVWQATKQRHWFGPTKAEIALVWLLGRGNANERKGGDR